MGFLDEFKTFAVQGNMVDLAVGFILGGAFSTIVKSLVDDIIMPPVGLLFGGRDFSDIFVLLKEGATAGPYATLEAAKTAGAITMNIGLFLNALISFIIIALVLFFIVRAINRMKAVPAGKATKK